MITRKARIARALDTNIASQYDLKPVRIFKKDGTATTISIRHADYIRLHAYAVKNGHRSAPAFLRSLAEELYAEQEAAAKTTHGALIAFGKKPPLSRTLRMRAQERTGIQLGPYAGKYICTLAVDIAEL